MSTYEQKIFASHIPQGMSGTAHAKIRVVNGGRKSIAQIL